MIIMRYYTAYLITTTMFLVATLTDEMTGEPEDVMVENPAYSPTLMAYKCEETANGLTTAKFSLNTPPECNVTDGSIYDQPVPKRAQLLQKLTRIPVMVTNCLVEVRILVGWCGGEFVAHNYMHASVETHRMLIE